jgi:hypothetical protein
VRKAGVRYKIGDSNDGYRPVDLLRWRAVRLRQPKYSTGLLIRMHTISVHHGTTLLEDRLFQQEMIVTMSLRKSTAARSITHQPDARSQHAQCFFLLCEHYHGDRLGLNIGLKASCAFFKPSRWRSSMLLAGCCGPHLFLEKPDRAVPICRILFDVWRLPTPTPRVAFRRAVAQQSTMRA